MVRVAGEMMRLFWGSKITAREDTRTVSGGLSDKDSIVLGIVVLLEG